MTLGLFKERPAIEGRVSFFSLTNRKGLRRQSPISDRVLLVSRVLHGFLKAGMEGMLNRADITPCPPLAHTAARLKPLRPDETR